MPDFISKDSDYYDLFERLARQELRVMQDAVESKTQVFEFDAILGACFIRFFPPEFSNYVQVGHLPIKYSLDDKNVKAFQQAYLTPERMREQHDGLARRKALEELLAVLRGQKESLLEFLVPTERIRQAESNTRVMTAEEYAQHFVDEEQTPAKANVEDTPVCDYGTLEPSSETFRDNPAHLEIDESQVDNALGSFWSLAHEIVFENPAPGTYGFESYDAYRVWGHRKHPMAVFIVRYFDGGRAWAMAAIVPCEHDKDAQLNGGIAYLTETRGDFIEGRPEDSAWHYGFEQLRGTEANVRLTEVLKLYREEGGLVFQTGAQGTPSETTAHQLEILAHTYFRLNAQEKTKNSLSGLEILANAYLDDEAGDQLLMWSSEKERHHQPRLEILAHPAHPKSVLIIRFEQDPAERQAAFYTPPDNATTSAHAFYTRAAELIADRDLKGPLPKPLASKSQFVRLEPAQAVPLLEEILHLIDDEIGGVYEFELAPYEQKMALQAS